MIIEIIIVLVLMGLSFALGFCLKGLYQCNEHLRILDEAEKFLEEAIETREIGLRYLNQAKFLLQET